MPGGTGGVRLRKRADVGVQCIALAVAADRGTVTVHLQLLTQAECLLLPPVVFGEGALVRRGDHHALVAVHDHAVAIVQMGGELRDAQHRRNAQRPRQNGGMAGFAAHFGQQRRHLFGADPHRHRRGQIPRQQHGSGGKRGNVHAVPPQQQGQHPGADVAHIGCPLTHHLVLHPGKHFSKRAAHRVQRGFGGLTAVDAFFHLRQHKRVVQHHDLTGQNFGLLVADPLLHIVSHPLRFFDKLGHRRLQPLLFSGFSGVDHRGIIQILLLYTDHASNADSGGSGYSLIQHKRVTPLAWMGLYSPSPASINFTAASSAACSSGPSH